uniref:Uncharacterized protein n=2 Tax=Oryza TaxID=4527 RepID=A0A0E0FGI9_ORYNI
MEICARAGSPSAMPPPLSSLASAASPPLPSLASAVAAAVISSSSPSNPSHELRPLHQLSSRLFSPLPPKPHSLSCSRPQAPRATTTDGSGAGDHGSDSGGNSGKGSGGGGGSDDDDCEEAEFGPLLRFDEVLRLAVARGVSLPADMEAAKDAGIWEVLLLRYFDLQAAPWPLAAMIRAFSMLHNRMLADPSFLFKVGTEVVIDSRCATFAEDFWAEFELLNYRVE